MTTADRPLLVVLNPRRIAQTLEAFDRLAVDRAYLTGYQEFELVDVMAHLVEGTDYSHYLLVSDDVVVTQPALDAVLGLLEDHPVASGWCNLDCVEPMVNLQFTPLPREEPDTSVWNLAHFAEVLGYPEPAVPTYFAGFALTGMSRGLWQRFPFQCYGNPGGGSDYHLCWRLQKAGIPIVAAREGFCFHVKERWAHGDRDPEKRLVFGERRTRIVCGSLA